MKLSNAAIGLAAVGAGLLVARMLRNRHEGGTEYVGGGEPPEPNRLIGYPLAQHSARDSAEALREASDRPL